MSRPVGIALLWILAGASAVLLVYESWTLLGSVLGPLLANPSALQTDFHYYYDAAQRFAGDRSQLYLASDDVIAGFAYPPPAIVPFMVLSSLPLGIALLIMTILSYAMIAVASWQWLKLLRSRGYDMDGIATVAVMLIVLALGPTYMNAVFGQVNAFVLASAVVFVSLAPSRAIAAGSVLALGAWLKVYPALMAAIGIWDRRYWRAILWTAVASAAIAIVLMPIVPLAAYADFFSFVLPSRSDKTALHVVNQSLVAFIERFRFPSSEFLFWTGHEAITVSWGVRAFNWACAAGCLAVLTQRLAFEIKAAALMALVAIVAPLGWGHVFVMALPLVMLQAIRMRTASSLTAITIAACIAAMMVPAGRHLPIDAAPDWLENIVYSRYLIATIVLMATSSNAPNDDRVGPSTIASA